MEDAAIKALWNKISDLRVELRADATDHAAFKQRVLTLLEGDPADKLNPGIIARMEELEAWKTKIKARDKRIAVWIGAVIAVGGFAAVVVKFVQSIMK